MFYIYIIYSHSADKYYIGHTDDYIRRLGQHNNSDFNTFTSKYRPWILKAVFSCGNDLTVAISIEKFIKKQKNRRIILHLINDEPRFGILAQLVRVPHLRD